MPLHIYDKCASYHEQNVKFWHLVIVFFFFFLSVAAPRIAFLLTCLHRLSIINTAMLHRCRRGLITPICSVIS